MKVNTFKKLEEGFFSDLARVGSDTVDAAKSSPEYKKKEQDRSKNKVNIETQKIYLQDFIEDLIVDLGAAIKRNVIDLNARGLESGFTPERIEKIRLIVNQAIADGKIKNATQLGSVLAKKYPDIWKNTTNKTEVINSLMSGDLTKLPYRPKLPPDPKKTAPTAESAWYERMNRLVESYISEQATESISQWIMRWFAAYMKGVDWESDKAGVETIAKEIESSYSKDRGKAAISKLANQSWNLIKDVSTTPYGARDVMSDRTTSNDPKVSDKELAKRIKDDTEKLKKTDPNLYDKIKNSLPESKIIKKKTS
jgi:hypothetical protein